jgi:hypothetical protein
MRFRRILGALAAAGLFVGVGAGSAAARPAPASARVYHLYNDTYAIPGSVRAGTSFYAYAWYMQDSPAKISVVFYYADIWSQVAATDRGFSVSWLNPVTRRWQASTNDSLSLPPGASFTMVPHDWYKIQFKVTVGTGVRPGTWHIGGQANGVMATNGGAAPWFQRLNGPDRTTRVHH